MSGRTKWVPRSCVFEITLACNLKCLHCGSSAGAKRENELDSEEASELIGQLAALGCESLTFSGGEPLIRDDWPELAARARSAGLRLDMITNGTQVADQAEKIAEAGFFSVGFSVDGPAEIHDELRGKEGSFSRLIDGVEKLVSLGVLIGAVTQINRLNIDKLDELHDTLVECGFSGWQVQLTMPHGRAAANRAELCLQPEDLPRLEQRLISVRKRTPMFFQAADNFGYMSKSEPSLRSGTPRSDRFFAGCQAGLKVIGITSDGTVRGCLSMPSEFDEGNVRNRPLAEIWKDPCAFPYNRVFQAEYLKGGCRECAFNRICRGGCKSLSFASTGDALLNPYCLKLV